MKWCLSVLIPFRSFFVFLFWSDNCNVVKHMCCNSVESSQFGCENLFLVDWRAQGKRINLGWFMPAPCNKHQMHTFFFIWFESARMGQLCTVHRQHKHQRKCYANLISNAIHVKQNIKWLCVVCLVHSTKAENQAAKRTSRFLGANDLSKTWTPANHLNHIKIDI